jgi:apolipoprotein N-acyltransferase
MKIPKNLNLRQTLEGMPLSFNPKALPGIQAAIQFDVSGKEPGTYHLRIENDECTFHEGPANPATMTIITSSEVWLKISHGEMTGYDALMQELYSATGDLELLMKMGELFQSADQVVYTAPASQRPAGPIALSGMAWMTVAFIPWILHWSTFNIPSASHWISVGLPLLISALIIGYRLVYDRPTWLDWSGLGFFAVSSALALTQSEGYARWGSVVSGLVMAGLWFSSLLLSNMPLSGEYSRWGFVKPLWGNSMFLYPNRVISLVWGWQFIAATVFGILAILLPQQILVFTLLRYLLLVPAFIFTAAYQKRVPVSQPKLTDAQLRFWAGMGLSTVSGFLLTASMPGYDVPYIGWIALVPLLSVLLTAESKKVYPLALPFGLVFSIGVHNWYPNIFSPALGYFLIVAVGTYYAGILQLGVWLNKRLPAPLKLLGLPVAWAATEFVKYISPVVENWWFVLLADSAWRFPSALQILSVTGVFGLSFVLMLANVSCAALLTANSGIPRRASLVALAVCALVLGAGALSMPRAENTFKVAVVTDMVNQDPLVKAQGEFAGLLATTPEISQAIFDTDAQLTREIAAQNPAFVVWPENEFTSPEDTRFTSQLGALAQETQAYITVDTAWRTPAGLYDTALLINPAGQEAGRRAKINITSGEADNGFIPGPREFPVFNTPSGKVGISVCWDVHRLWIIRELARAGAQIVLMPMDNDFNGTPTFPPFHAADAVFRAVENHLAFGLGTVNGLSMVIDPYGRITAEGKINQRSVIVGDVYVIDQPTIYTRIGDWFGWAMVATLIGFVAISIFKK